MFFGFLKKKVSFPTQERRREYRYPAEDEFIIEFAGREKEIPGSKDSKSRYVGASRDISLHGLRFVTTYKLRKKEMILLNFRFPHEFPGEKHLSLPALVVRVYRHDGMARYRIGCALKYDNPRIEETIRQFIHWLEHRTSP